MAQIQIEQEYLTSRCDLYLKGKYLECQYFQLLNTGGSAHGHAPWLRHVEETSGGFFFIRGFFN